MSTNWQDVNCQHAMKPNHSWPVPPWLWACHPTANQILPSRDPENQTCMIHSRWQWSCLLQIVNRLTFCEWSTVGDTTSTQHNFINFHINLRLVKADCPALLHSSPKKCMTIKYTINHKKICQLYSCFDDRLIIRRHRCQHSLLIIRSRWTGRKKAALSNTQECIIPG